LKDEIIIRSIVLYQIRVFKKLATPFIPCTVTKQIELARKMERKNPPAPVDIGGKPLKKSLCRRSI